MKTFVLYAVRLWDKQKQNTIKHIQSMCRPLCSLYIHIHTHTHARSKPTLRHICGLYWVCEDLCWTYKELQNNTMTQNTYTCSWKSMEQNQNQKTMQDIQSLNPRKCKQLWKMSHKWGRFKCSYLVFTLHRSKTRRNKWNLINTEAVNVDFTYKNTFFIVALGVTALWQEVESLYSFMLLFWQHQTRRVTHRTAASA